MKRKIAGSSRGGGFDPDEGLEPWHGGETQKVMKKIQDSELKKGFDTPKAGRDELLEAVWGSSNQGLSQRDLVESELRCDSSTSKHPFEQDPLATGVLKRNDSERVLWSVSHWDLSQGTHLAVYGDFTAKDGGDGY